MLNNSKIEQHKPRIKPIQNVLCGIQIAFKKSDTFSIIYCRGGVYPFGWIPDPSEVIFGTTLTDVLHTHHTWTKTTVNLQR